jgi:hypothetical protein
MLLVLFPWFLDSFTSRLQSALQDVKMISNKADQEKYNRMLLLVQELNMRVNAFSFWGIVEEGKEVDREILDSVMLTIDKLCDFCRLEVDAVDDTAIAISIPMPDHVLPSMLPS